MLTRLSSEYTCPECGRVKVCKVNSFIVCRPGREKGHSYTVKMIETKRGIVQK